MTATHTPSPPRPLRQALVFIVVVLALSWSFQATLVARGGVQALGPHWLVALMCIPGAVAIVQRGLSGLGWADAGLRPGALRWHGVAVAIPLLLALLAAALSSWLDLRHFAPLAPGVAASMGTVGLTVLAMGVVGAIGEEFGWRGFLLPMLVASGIRRPILVTGVAWALWHMPLIVLGGFYQTRTPWLMALVYALGILAINGFICALRMRSGSVWVAATAHAAHNFIFQFVVPVFLLTAAGANAGWWDLVSGDTGLIVAVLYAAVCVLGVHAMQRATSTPPP